MAKQASPNNTVPLSPEEAMAVDYLTEDFGAAVVTIKRKRNATPEACKVMHAYVISLIKGDGSPPAGFCNEVLIRDMRVAFVTTCEKRLVGRPLPGQNTDWYDDLVIELRSASRPKDELAERRRNKPRGKYRKATQSASAG
jgi:hypothetical protein